MNADDGHGRPKIEAAKGALRSVVDGLPAGAPVGLRVYGHRFPNTDKANGCRDTELVSPVRPVDPPALKAAIDSYRATGFTPIGYSLQEGAKDLPPEGDRTIILVSDGEDTCAPPDPCQVARDLSAQGLHLKVETVGFQVDPAARAQLECIAQATGGSYRDAGDAAALADQLKQISTRALRQYQAGGTAVQGGAAAREASVLEPGRYLDSILPGETLWYAVEVAEGQSLSVTGTLVGSPDVPSRGLAQRMFEVQLVEPSLENNDRAYVFDDQPGSKTVSVKAETGPVEAKKYGSSQEPGRYYARVNFDAKYSPVPQREYPLELEIQLAGGQPTTTSTAAPGAASPTNPILPAKGLPVVPALVGVVIGALIAAVVVLALRLRKTRPPTT